MSLTDYGENLFLTNYKTGGTAYLGLFTLSPGESTPGTEVSGNGYARQAVTFGTVSGGSMSNSADIEFDPATGTWGTVNSWGLFDASTGGNLVWYGALDIGKTVTAGDIFRVAAGNLILSMD